MKMMAETQDTSYPMPVVAPHRSNRAQQQSASDAAIYKVLETGETNRVTFCAEVGDAFEMSRQIASFANAEGGLIVFGAVPPETIMGCNTQLVERIYEEARQYLEPEPMVSFHTLQVDGKPLAALKVGPSSALVLSAGGAFVREDATIVAMSADDLTQRAAKLATSLAGKQVAAKSNATPQELEPIVRATLMPLARAIVQQTEIIERLHDDLAAAARLDSRAKEWVISAVVGAVVAQVMTMMFG